MRLTHIRGLHQAQMSASYVPISRCDVKRVIEPLRRLCHDIMVVSVIKIGQFTIVYAHPSDVTIRKMLTGDRLMSPDTDTTPIAGWTRSWSS